MLLANCGYIMDKLKCVWVEVIMDNLVSSLPTNVMGV
jgi:hypothetical protein